MNNYAIDVSGQRFGALIAMYPTKKRYQSSIVWHFKCDCGNEKDLPINSVKAGRVKSCGCRINQKAPKKRDQRTNIGDRYGNLTVIELLGQSDKDRHYQSRVRCDCGREYVTRDTFLITKKITKCPRCSQLDAQKHGLSDTPLFYMWQGMRDRCFNSKSKVFSRYGGRGITVCQDWLDSNNFIEWAIKNGYKEGLWLGRKDVDGNYEPSNCIFATQEELTKYRKNVIKIHYEGQLLTLSEIEKITGLSHELIYQRLTKNGWSEYDATHVLPDSHYYSSKKMRETVLTNIKTGEVKRFDSCSRASKFLGEKSTYLLTRSYTLKKNVFTCNNYIVEIMENKEDE